MGRRNTMAAVLLAVGALGCGEKDESCNLYSIVNPVLFGRIIDLGGDAPRPGRWRLCLNDACFALHASGHEAAYSIDGGRVGDLHNLWMDVTHEPDGRFRVHAHLEFGENYDPGEAVRVELLGVLKSGKRLRIPGHTVHFRRHDTCHVLIDRDWI